MEVAGIVLGYRDCWCILNDSMNKFLLLLSVYLALWSSTSIHVANILSTCHFHPCHWALGCRETKKSMILTQPSEPLIHSSFCRREPDVSELLTVLQAPLWESSPLRTSFRVPEAFHTPCTLWVPTSPHPDTNIGQHSGGPGILRPSIRLGLLTP